MNSEIQRSGKRQEGAALLVAVVTLLIAAMIGLGALEHTKEESTAGARSRNTTRTLHAADAGIEFAVARLSQSPPNLNAFSLDVGGATVESRSRSQGSAQDLDQHGMTAPPEGFSLNVGSDASFSGQVYQVNVTSNVGTSVVELEARFARMDAGGSSY